MTENKQFYMDNETTYMINTSKDKLLQFMKHKGQRSIHCVIVDELPYISEVEDGVVYIIVDWIADNSIACCQYYTVIGNMWVTASENVDMSVYMK